jgi:hypothetical protein
MVFFVTNPGSEWGQTLNASEVDICLTLFCFGGHSRILVTYRRMKYMFAWKGMKIEVQEFVKACVVCQ